MNPLPKIAARAALLTLAMPLALPVAMPAQAADAPADTLATINRAIRAISTLKGSFEQMNPDGTIQRGKLLLKQPGHIRFDYAGGDFLIVADGRSLYMIDYEVNQQQRWPIGDSPLGALLDPKRDLTRYGKLLGTANANTLAVEVRDKAHPEHGTLTLAFTRKAGAPGGLELSGWVALDAQGNRTVIRLNGLQYGAPIADSAFKWKDPRGPQVGPRR